MDVQWTLCGQMMTLAKWGMKNKQGAWSFLLKSAFKSIWNLALKNLNQITFIFLYFSTKHLGKYFIQKGIKHSAVK